MKKIIGSIMAGVALVGAAILGDAGAAQAASVRQMCSAWNESTIVSDTPSWGRIGQRMCVQWKAGGNQVRQKIEARFDWPMSGCTVSVPLGATCPVDRLIKRKEVILDEFRMYLDYQNPDRTGNSVSCNRGRQRVQPFTQLGGAVTMGCTSVWHTQKAGAYWARGHLTFRRGATVLQLPTAKWYGVRF